MQEVTTAIMELALALIAVAVPAAIAYLVPAAKAALKAAEASKYASGIREASPVLYDSLRGAAIQFLGDAADGALSFTQSDVIPAMKKFAREQAADIEAKTNVKVGNTDEMLDALIAQAVREAKLAYSRA